jgi:hypothetical protein
LDNKALKAEAEMNRDEWISEGSAIIGLILVAFGFCGAMPVPRHLSRSKSCETAGTMFGRLSAT